MTKKQLLTAPACGNTTSSASSNVNISSTSLLQRLASLYTTLLEEPVSPRRALRFVHAQLAAVALFLPIDMPELARLLCLAWFALACMQCKSKD